MNSRDGQLKGIYPRTQETFRRKDSSKSLQYKARANIKPDDMFQKEIDAIKQYAERQFVEALLLFHERRLESHAKKLERAKYAKHRNKTFVNSRAESQSPSANIANNVHNDVKRINNLEKQLFDIKEMLCTHLLNYNKKMLKATAV